MRTFVCCSPLLNASSEEFVKIQFANSNSRVVINMRNYDSNESLAMMSHCQ